MNGEPVLPLPLRALLTDTCEACGHATLSWPGALSALEAQIAELDKTIAEHRRYLDLHVQGATTLLAEPVTT